MKTYRSIRPGVFALAFLVLGIGAAALTRAEGRGPRIHKQVIIPGEDRFTPFGLTIRSGDFVQ